MLRRCAKGLAAAGGGAVVAVAADHLWVCRNLRDRREVVREPAGKRVLVLGGGVVGVASAAVLANAGFRVTLVERHGDTAVGTSGVNAGTMRPSQSGPVVTAGTFGRFVRTLGDDPILKFDWPVCLTDPYFWRWGLRVLLLTPTASLDCPQPEFLVRHSDFLIRATKDIASREGLPLPVRPTASVNVYVDHPAQPDAFESGRRTAAKMHELYGIGTEVLDADELASLEPSLGELKRQGSLRGGVLAHCDESGDCGGFTQRLARRIAERYGVRFVLGRAVTELVPGPAGDRLERVRTDSGEELEADYFVVAMGCGSAPLLRQLGIYLPIYPVKGYSFTFPERALGGLSLKQESLVLYPAQMFVTQYRDEEEPGTLRLRFTSIAEWAGWDEMRATPACVEVLRDLVRSAFPQLPERAWADAELRVGGRPWTPDDLPVVSGTPYGNLYINAGHGHFGWRFACGTAVQLLCIMTGREPPMEEEMLSLGRFRKLWRQGRAP